MTYLLYLLTNKNYFNSLFQVKTDSVMEDGEPTNLENWKNKACTRFYIKPTVKSDSISVAFLHQHKLFTEDRRKYEIINTCALDATIYVSLLAYKRINHLNVFTESLKQIANEPTALGKTKVRNNLARHIFCGKFNYQSKVTTIDCAALVDSIVPHFINFNSISITENCITCDFSKKIHQKMISIIKNSQNNIIDAICEALQPPPFPCYACKTLKNSTISYGPLIWIDLLDLSSSLTSEACPIIYLDEIPKFLTVLKEKYKLLAVISKQKCQETIDHYVAYLSVENRFFNTENGTSKSKYVPVSNIIYSQM